MSAIDYAWARPPLTFLKSLGIATVGRYVGPSGWGKTITTSEAQALNSAGLAYWLVFENGANDASGGFNAGQSNARLALQNIPDAVFGFTRPIYFAEDTSIVPSACVPYWQGICSVISAAMVGVYGEGALCQLLYDQGLASWFWQSASTSFPGNQTTLPITHIQQGVGNPVPNFDTDPDVLMKLDVGQFPSPIQQEQDVAIIVLQPAPNGQPLDIPSNPGVAETVLVSFDALVNGTPTVPLRGVMHKADGSDAWVVAQASQGSVPAPLPADAHNQFPVTKGWPVTFTIPSGYDSLSLRNNGTTYALTVRV